MATLQDVRAFVKQQGDLTSEELEAKLASEFKMSRDEAGQMLRGLSSEDPSLETVQPTIVDAAVVAAGLSGSSLAGTTHSAAGTAALMTEMEPETAEPHETNSGNSETSR